MIERVKTFDSMENISALFAGWQESMIWSCLQGVMGALYTDSLETPASAIALLGDFCFLAGRPDKEMVLYGASRQDFIIMVPKDENWASLIETCCQKRARKVVRYALRKESNIFNLEKLQSIVDGLPAGYTLKWMDEALFLRCRQIGWCRDWVSQYADYAAYQKHGLGVVILKDGEPVSGASSYSGYRGGIEVEIDTRKDYRRLGLACICGAKLILECQKRGWYPSWDAQNQWSLALAKKLGYHFDRAYTAYEVVKAQTEEGT